jgi:hypothetical protein
MSIGLLSRIPSESHLRCDEKSINNGSRPNPPMNHLHSDVSPVKTTYVLGIMNPIHKRNLNPLAIEESISESVFNFLMISFFL